MLLWCLFISHCSSPPRHLSQSFHRPPSLGGSVCGKKLSQVRLQRKQTKGTEICMHKILGGMPFKQHLPSRDEIWSCREKLHSVVRTKTDSVGAEELQWPTRHPEFEEDFCPTWFSYWNVGPPGKEEVQCAGEEGTLWMRAILSRSFLWVFVPVMITGN